MYIVFIMQCQNVYNNSKFVSQRAKINKNVDIKFSAHTRFWNMLHQVRLKSKDWNAK